LKGEADVFMLHLYGLFSGAAMMSPAQPQIF